MSLSSLIQVPVSVHVRVLRYTSLFVIRLRGSFVYFQMQIADSFGISKNKSAIKIEINFDV